MHHASKYNLAKQLKKWRKVDMPLDFTDFRLSPTRPLVFTPRTPEPLEGTDLNEVAGEVKGDTYINQKPYVPLDPVRFGLPPPMITFLKRRGIQSVTVVQAKALTRMYAGHDVVMCAATGSGKTFALCVGLASRLMRQGPPKQLSTLFLVPTAVLGHAVEKLLKEMWCYPNDPYFLYRMDETMDRNVCYQRLLSKGVSHTGNAGRPVYRDLRPYVIVSTAEVFLPLYLRVRDSMQHRASCRQKRHNFSLTPPLPTIDTVIVDEADEVLPPSQPHCAGNQLMKHLYRHVKYQSPIQLIFNSATFSASNVTHVRRFLRKSLLAASAARLFEDEIGEESKQLRKERHFARVAIPFQVELVHYTADGTEDQRAIFDEVLLQADVVVFSALVILPSRSACNVFFDEVVLRLRSVQRVDCNWSHWDYSIPGGKPIFHSFFTRHSFHAGQKKESATFYFCSSNGARGLDIPGLSHVFLIAVPATPLEFAHWAGRVGRLGADGTCVVLSPRVNARHYGELCNALDIPFNVKR